MEYLLLFGHPSTVTTCQNAWSGGLDGSPCTFDREKADGFRKKQLETKHNVGTSEHIALASCPNCAHTKEDVEKYRELKAYVESESSSSTCADPLSCYVEVPNDPWEGKHRFLRAFTCEGQEGVIRCKSKKFGAGLEEGSENTPCAGFYGGRIVLGDNEKQADGSSKRIERTWIPGEVNPAPAVGITWDSSSESIPSDPDQGQEQGEWSSSS